MSVPTYQYVCTQCGQDLEVQQSFSDASLTECPACAGRLRKVFNAVGVVFKGSGFYRNDSRGGSSTDKDAGSKESKDTKDSGSKSSDSTSSADSGSKESGSKSSDSTPKKSDSSSSTASKAPASTS